MSRNGIDDDVTKGFELDARKLRASLPDDVLGDIATGIYSCAISLKRIADTLEAQPKQGSPLTLDLMRLSSDERQNLLDVLRSRM